MIGHNAWTDWATEIVKSFLHAEESKESNELDKKVPLPLKVLMKVHICVFVVLIFWQFSEKIKELIPRIQFSFLNPVYALRRRLKNQITQYSPKSDLGLLWRKNVLCEVGSIDFQMMLWSFW